MPSSRQWYPTQVFLPGEFYWAKETGKSLADYSPWGHQESDMTDKLSLHMWRIYVFRAVFVLQQKSAEGTEISHTLPASAHA